MRTAVKADRLGLTEDQFLQFSRACNQVWASLAHMVVDGRSSIPRCEVIEVCVDAENFVTHGKPYGESWKQWNRFCPVIDVWVSDNYGTPKFNQLMKEVFPFGRYTS